MAERPSAAERGISDDAASYEELVSDAEGADTLAPESRWLYKQGGHVFGPFPAKLLLEQLYDGKIEPDTHIAPDGESDFMELRRYGAFRTHLPKVEAHRKAIDEIRAKERAQRKKTIRNRLAIAVVAVVAVGGGGYGTVAFVRHSRIQEAERIAKENEAKILSEIEQIQARVKIEPELVALVEKPEPEDPKGPKKGRRPTGPAKPKEELTGELTQGEILEGLGRGFVSLKRCIVEQIQRDAESVPPRLVLSFSVDNEGVVRGIELDARNLRRAPMMGCFEKVLASVRYRKYKGEVQNIQYPINIGR